MKYNIIAFYYLYNFCTLVSFIVCAQFYLSNKIHTHNILSLDMIFFFIFFIEIVQDLFSL